VKGAAHAFDKEAYLAGKLSPVFFGSAVNNFGVQELLDSFVENAPGPHPRESATRVVQAEEEAFTASCSRSRRTWIQITATALRSYVSCRVATSRA